MLLDVASLDASNFVECFGKSASADVKDTFSGLSKPQLTTVAEGLKQQAAAAVGAVHADEDEQGTLDVELALSIMRACAVLGTDMLQHCHAQQQAPPPALFAMAQLLHDNGLLALGTELPLVQEPISRLCLLWWEHQQARREELVSHLLVYLLVRAIATGKAATIKAIWSLKDAYDMLDYEDDDIQYTVQMVLRAMIAPGFVTRVEGRRFLAHMMNKTPQITREMLAVARNQISPGKRSLLEAVGDVLLRAWREAQGGCLYEVEQGMQGLISAALGASTPAMAANLRVVLNQLHMAKQMGVHGSVDGLLVRLYEPLLYRALAAANPAVRRNAVGLLADAFPLVDPEVPTEEGDEQLRRQLAAFTEALVDEAPAVRAVAVAGICKVLNQYFELLPQATVALYVARLAEQLAYDAASPAVRVAVLQGLGLLLDNTHAQPLLKKALPKLAPLLMDGSPRVRLALAELLEAMGASRELHWWDVLPQESLLAALSEESNADVAARLLAVLQPSYFPGPEEGVARVAGLLRADPAAGQSFCAQLAGPLLTGSGRGSPSVAGLVALEHVLALAAGLAAHLVDNLPDADPCSPPRKVRGARGGAKAAAAAAGHGAKRRKGKVASVDDGSDADEVVVAAQPESVESWTRLLAGAAELCCGIGKALDLELSADDEAAVAGAFPPDMLSRLMDACPSEDAQQHVWRIAEALPRLPASRQLQGSLLELLAKGELVGAEGDQGKEEELSAVLAALAAGPAGKRLAAMLCQALGMEWRTSPASPAAASGTPQAPAMAPDDDEPACWACGALQPEHNMLMCDGCDAAYHTDCLRPPLACVPQGDWFCPGCQQAVDGCLLGADAAARCVSLLLAASSGRHLLTSAEAGPSYLARLLPALQYRATAAARAAHEQPAQASSSSTGGSGGLLAAGGAAERGLRAAMLWLRAALHMVSMTPTDDVEQQVAANAAVHGATSAGMACLAAGVALVQAAAADHGGGGAAGARMLEALTLLLQSSQRWLSLLGDALQLVTVGHLAGSDAGIEAVVAGGRQSLQLLLAAMQLWQEEEGEDLPGSMTAGLLGQSSQLLKALLPAAAAAADAVDAGCSFTTAARASLASWADEWAAAITSGPLVGSAAAVRNDMPAIVAGLLEEQAEAGSRGWLKCFASTLGEAVQQSASEPEAENADPNARQQQGDASTCGGRGKASGAQLDGAATAQLGPVPAPVAYLIAGARFRKIDARLANASLDAALSWAQGGQWNASLGAMRMACMLNAAKLSDAAVGQLQELQRCAQGHSKGQPSAALMARLLADRLAA